MPLAPFGEPILGKIGRGDPILAAGRLDLSVDCGQKQLLNLVEQTLQRLGVFVHRGVERLAAQEVRGHVQPTGHVQQRDTDEPLAGLGKLSNAANPFGQLARVGWRNGQVEGILNAL